MTIDTLNEVLRQLQEQLRVILTAPTEKPVIQHCNAIEIHGAIQLATQLIQQEQIQLQAPPGSTGPKS